MLLEEQLILVDLELLLEEVSLMFAPSLVRVLEMEVQKHFCVTVVHVLSSTNDFALGVELLGVSDRFGPFPATEGNDDRTKGAVMTFRNVNLLTTSSRKPSTFSCIRGY